MALKFFYGFNSAVADPIAANVQAHQNRINHPIGGKHV